MFTHRKLLRTEGNATQLKTAILPQSFRAKGLRPKFGNRNFPQLLRCDDRPPLFEEPFAQMLSGKSGYGHTNNPYKDLEINFSYLDTTYSQHPLTRSNMRPFQALRLSFARAFCSASRTSKSCGSCLGAVFWMCGKITGDGKLMGEY